MIDTAQFLTFYNKLRRNDSRYQVTAQQIGWFTFPFFEQFDGICHAFSCRTGGVSDGFLSSLNLSFSHGYEPREKTIENYERFCDAIGIDPSTLVMDTYEHGCTVRKVDRSDCGAGYCKEPLPACDGLITNDPAVTLVTGHADCMAFYVYDPVKHAIGLAHAGWRGALVRIGKQLVQMMQTHFSSDPTDLIVGVGPSICPKCFEVGEDVADAFCNAFPYVPCRKAGKPGKAYIDLWMIAAAQFMEAGICPSNMSIMDVCTVEDPSLFSHRGDKGLTGGMSAFFKLNEKSL